VNNEQQTQQADDPSGPGWRDVEVGEVLRHTDMFRDSVGAWVFTENKGLSVREGWERTYRRRIEPPQPKKPDDPSGLGWRWVRHGEKLELHDMMQADGEWWPAKNAGKVCLREGMYRRRIEPEQPSDSEPETMDDLRRRLAECEVLLAEAERGGRQVNAELQQLREQVREATVRLDDAVSFNEVGLVTNDLRKAVSDGEGP
jgi:hypothetical protein